jgi:MFS family permease
MNTIQSKAPLLWLALGTFAVGTESFMIAGLLPGMAADLAVTLPQAGQLVTAFALAYALSSPVLTALTGRIERRSLLIGAMLAFAAANVLAWTAPGYLQLMAARILLAFAAGLYVPGANALASTVAAPERRGSAIAIVNGGLSLAIALGVPLGALVGDGMGWRTTFGGVAILAALAALGLAYGLPKGIGAGLATATLRERVADGCPAGHPADAGSHHPVGDGQLYDLHLSCRLHRCGDAAARRPASALCCSPGAPRRCWAWPSAGAPPTGTGRAPSSSPPCWPQPSPSS